MDKIFSSLAALVLLTIIVSVTSFVNFKLGYSNGQRDALRGIYSIPQDQRDQIDPQGQRHILAPTTKPTTKP